MCIRSIIDWFLNWDTNRLKQQVEFEKKVESIKDKTLQNQLDIIDSKLHISNYKAKLNNTKLEIQKEKLKNVNTK